MVKDKKISELKNKGEEIDISQNITVAQDKAVTTEVGLSAQSGLQDIKRYHEEGKELAEEKLGKIAKHYRLAKEQAELITSGLQHVYNHNNANRQLFEQKAEEFKIVHDLTPNQAIIKYQAILDKLQPAIRARDQERKLLQQLSNQLEKITVLIKKNTQIRIMLIS